MTLIFVCDCVEEAGGHLEGTGCLSPLCGFGELNSGYELNSELVASPGTVLFDGGF